MKYFTSLLLGLSLVACDDADEDKIPDTLDCAPEDADIEASSQKTFFKDADGDGYGNEMSQVLSCEQPAGYVLDNTDCDDADADINPGALEACDEIDNNCDGTIDTDATEGLTTVYADLDGDGYGSALSSAEVCAVEDGWVENADDCNDANADISPEADEVCDSIDNDCDDLIDIDDDSVTGTTTVYADTDGDGFGDAETGTQVCDIDTGWVENADDCNDTHGAINPAAEEILGDGVDQDCDAQELCYEDLDGDGFGTETTTLISGDGSGVYDCAATANASLSWDDCDDSSAAVNPTATEICDSIDNDCDALIDDADDSTDVTTGSQYYADADGDSFGSATEVWACEQGDLADNMNDCDDGLASSNPMATDVYGDGIDQNCDGVDGTDVDGDGFASVASGGTDCNDNDAAINPAAIEICDGGIDNDCDALVDDQDDSLDTSITVALYVDGDGDGFGEDGTAFFSCDGSLTGYVANNTDCDDTDEFTYPGAAEIQSTVECLTDADDDGWSSTDLGTGLADCDDGNADVSPDATEVCDGIDNNCDASIDENLLTTYYVDADGDGYGDSNEPTVDECTLPEGYAEIDGDCNDAEALSNPGLTEVCDGIDNNCDTQTDENLLTTYYVDADGDGYGDSNEPTVDECEAPEGYSDMDGDCDDTEALSNPGLAEVCDGIDNNCDTDVDEGLLVELYPDMDGDGYGAEIGEMVCDDTEGYVDNNTDCDDTLASTNPMATDIAGDGIDQNCDGGDGTDIDGDGFVSVISGGTDCDDSDASIFPGAVEICDGGIDNDCDGLIDDQDDSLDLNGTTMLYGDWDNDGFGDANDVFNSCELTAIGYVDNDTDCDDLDEFTYPGAAFNQSITECLTDYDGDGWSEDSIGSGVFEACYDIAMADSFGDGWTGNAIDVYEDGNLAHSFTLDAGAEGEDSFCVADGAAVEFYWTEGIFPEDVSYVLTGPDGAELLNEAPAYTNGDLMHSETAIGATEIFTDADCDDWDADISPDAVEECDGLDNNCDGDIDEELLSTFYVDADGDGYGDTSQTEELCELMEGYSDIDGDCDDDEVLSNPGEVEVCDEIDNNCDTQIDEGVQIELYPDTDGDGFGAEIGEMVCADAEGYVENNEDCNDTLASYNPLVTDIAGDGYDQNCDGEDGTDSDGDGFVSLASGGDDCDDLDDTTYPGSAELDAADFGEPDACMKDSDDDGYGDNDDGGNSDIVTGTDCGDDDETINIEATEIWYDGVDQDCNGLSDFDQDGDGDDIEEYDCDGDGVAETSCDLDGDGVDDYVAGNDCDDEDVSFNSGAAEVWFDGIDQNCDDLSDFDQDMDGDDIAELDCDGDGVFDPSCDLDGDGVDDYVAGTDCDDYDELLNNLDLDGDGFTSCDGDCWDVVDDDDGDGIADSSFTYPGAAFNDSLTDCLTDMDGDGYSPNAAAGFCFEFTTHDTYGDGWNGNTIHIHENGVETGTITNQNLDGSSGSTSGGEYNYDTYCLQSETTVVEFYYADGNYNSEVSFEMFDNDGVLIAEGQGSGTDTLTVNSVAYTDGDLFFTYDISGNDCDDTDADVYSGSDVDGDGFLACQDDCDDRDANIYPGAPETWYDGSVMDCDSLSDYDQDMDGDDVMEIDCLGDGVIASECDFDGDGVIDWTGGTDCDDEDPSVNGLDEDGDTFSSCDGDCEDGDAAIFPGATETFYDGVDQDCNGLSDFDQDEDGFDDVAYGGDDCDDLDVLLNPAADNDGDGSFACTDDCDDFDGNNFPGNVEICDDGIDQDCDGVDLPCALDTCLDWYNAGFTADDIYTLTNGVDEYDAYCDMTNGGWTLVGSIGDPRLLPFMDNYLGTQTVEAAGTNWFHDYYADIDGTEVRVGDQAASGATSGNFFEINDCSTDDAACWYGEFINQNDGDTFGAWIGNGGSWNLVPSGCTNDTCPATNGDRDHSADFRIAIFGGDCHSSCNGSADTRNGFTYYDYGTSVSPSRIGSRAYWSDASTGGGTGLGDLINASDYGQSGTEYRDLWIR